LALVALSVIEQRHRAVMAVLDGAGPTVVAAEVGVSRQSVHSWLARYRATGLAGLADGSSGPRPSPNRASAQVEARVCELRRALRRWKRQEASVGSRGREEDEVSEIRTTVDATGRAYIDLATGSGGEIRDSVALDELEAADGVPALSSIVLHFDFYGRLARIEVTGSADSVLPPALLEAAART
jgi:hypothetical protein